MKKIIAAVLMTAMLASLAACGKSSESSETEYIYGKIESISGNDVVLLLAEERSDKSDDEGEAETEAAEKNYSGKRSSRSKGEKSEGFTRPENGEMPSDFDSEKFSGKMPEGFSKPENGEMPSDFDSEKFSGKMPEGFSKPENGEMPSDFDSEKFSGKMPEGFSKPENGEMPSDFDSEKFSGKMPEDFTRSENGNKSDRGSKNSNYTLTGEQEELRIPVGTEVTTLSGVKTDFEAIEKGNIIKCSVEKDSDGKDVVTEVWVVE